MKHRRSFYVLLALEIFLIVLGVFLAGWWMGFGYPFFDRIAERGAKIPGLDSGISPQGLCALPEDCPYSFAMSGYLKDEPSRVYLISDDPVMDKKDVERYLTFTEGGKPIQTHFGGVTASEDRLFVASGKKIIHVSLDKVLACENGKAVEIDGSFSTGLQNAFCYIFGDTFFAGEFYRAGNYETDKTHHLETEEGEHPAFIYQFPLETVCTETSAAPEKAISVCGLVQGVAVNEEKILLSCSYGLPDSTLRIYDNPLADEPQQTVTIGEKEVPLYILTGGTSVVLPCMSEELFLRDGKVYILFESMSMKYRFVVHSRITRIVSMNLQALLSPDAVQRTFFGLSMEK